MINPADYGMDEWGAMIPVAKEKKIRKKRGSNRVARIAPLAKIPLMDRFMSKIEVDGTHWIWQGAVNRGYGVILADDQTKYAHRVAYELFSNEKIPQTRRVKTCDADKLCVYPGHLSLVSTRIE